MLQDLSFFSSARLKVLSTLAHLAAYVIIRSHYTKGVQIFEHHMFMVIPSSPFYPVLASTSIIKRWSIMAPYIDTPLFCFLSAFFSKTPQYLSDAQMISGLRRVALLTHPEKNKLVYHLVKAISTHSLRVFACLYLMLTGWNKEAIARQCHWDSNAKKNTFVKLYSKLTRWKYHSFRHP